MSSLANRKCCVCHTSFSHTIGQKMELNDDVKVENVNRILNKKFSKGDILCGTCRALFYQKKAIATEEELNQRLTGTESVSDLDFHIVQETPPAPVELVEMEFQRVVSTHAYCFLCGLSEKVVTVPFKGRLQIFARKRIFVPKGNS